MKCYCQLPVSYEFCCQPYHLGNKTPESSEKLMRARYSAFCLKDFDYLLKTHHPDTINEFDIIGNRNWADAVQFIDLKIINIQKVNLKNEKVHFEVSYLEQGRIKTHKEISLFKSLNSTWFYYSAEYPH